MRNIIPAGPTGITSHSRSSIASKADIKGIIEVDESVTQTLETHRNALKEMVGRGP